MKVRDCFWLFASRAHDDDIWLGRSMNDRFTRWSRITPAEGCAMLGVSNVIMVVSDGVPAPYSAEAYGYMESFCRMRNIVWSITGSSGFRAGNEEDFIVSLSERYPNVTGAYADDFLGAGQSTAMNGDEKKNLLRSIRRKLSKAARPIDLWLTLYTRDLDTMDPAHAESFERIALWTWDYRELTHLPENFAKAEKLFPDKKLYLGIYMLDYPSGESIPTDFMRLQCEFGLSMLKEGRIDGMVFLTNCVMGVGLPSEYWLREWIDRVGDEEI